MRLEAVGRLASGIAHDFNNYLTAILSYADFVKEGVGDRADVREDVDEIIAAARLGEKLVRQLLAFTRKQPLTVRPVNLSEVVERIEQLLARLLGARVQIVTELDPALLPAQLAPASMEQILTNMAVNARDAMPQGGTLTISTSNVTVRDERVWVVGGHLEGGDYVSLKLSDTGTGMDNETQSRIFEPFFTTKPPQQGSGLGPGQLLRNRDSGGRRHPPAQRTWTRDDLRIVVSSGRRSPQGQLCRATWTAVRRGAMTAHRGATCTRSRPTDIAAARPTSRRRWRQSCRRGCCRHRRLRD